MFAQFKNFGTSAKLKPQPNYLFSIYGYYDLIREKGIGFQYHFLPNYSVDVSFYQIVPNNYLRDKVLQWDYYDLKGYGFSIRPKYHFAGLSKWYASPNISFEWLSHGKTWVEYYNGKGSDIYHSLEETNGKAFTFGVSLGRKISLKTLYIEPFVGFGYTDYKGEKTTYEIDNNKVFSGVIYPKEERYNQGFLQLFAAIKIGFSFKKSKKHLAIDKKFDVVYNPKVTALKNYINTIEYNNPQTSKYLKQACNRYKALDRNALFKYKRYYNDTSMFYAKMDDLITRINNLIILGNK